MRIRTSSLRKLFVGVSIAYFTRSAFALKTTKVHTLSKDLPPAIKEPLGSVPDGFESYPFGEQYQYCLMSIEQALAGEIHKRAKKGESVSKLTKDFYSLFTGESASAKESSKYVFLDTFNGLTTLNTLAYGQGESPDVFLYIRELKESSTTLSRGKAPLITLSTWEKGQVPRFLPATAAKGEDLPAVESVLLPLSKDDDGVRAISPPDDKALSLSILNRAVEKGNTMLKAVNLEMTAHCKKLNENILEAEKRMFLKDNP